MMDFPISGVETYWWLPIVVAFAISVFTSTGGVTGAFLILPFQVSFLGFTGPGVSSTNLIYNIVAIPPGVWRYHREKRLVWPLAWAIILSTLPGMFIGAIIRFRLLPDPANFKLFVGFVLVYLSIRLFINILGQKKTIVTNDQPKRFDIAPLEFNLKRIGFEFNDQPYYVPTLPLFILCLIVGVVGGTYGIGGGAIIAPFLVAVYNVPVYAVAGAALLSTFATSIAGVAFYLLLPLIFPSSPLSASPDWLLGAMFGFGGMAGIYVGAKLQKIIPPGVIKAILAVSILFIALRYILGYFL